VRVALAIAAGGLHTSRRVGLPGANPRCAAVILSPGSVRRKDPFHFAQRPLAIKTLTSSRRTVDRRYGGVSGDPRGGRECTSPIPFPGGGGERLRRAAAVSPVGAVREPPKKGASRCAPTNPCGRRGRGWGAAGGRGRRRSRRFPALSRAGLVSGDQRGGREPVLAIPFSLPVIVIPQARAGWRVTSTDPASPRSRRPATLSVTSSTLTIASCS
jgi:hypothetical protein